MDSNTSATVDPTKMYNYINGMAENPMVFIILGVVLIAYFIFFVSLGNKGVDTSQQNSIFNSSSSQNEDTSENGFLFIIVAILFMLIVYNAFKYFFSVDIVASISQLFTGGNEINIQIDKQTEDENIGENVEDENLIGEGQQEEEEEQGGRPIPIDYIQTPQVFNIPGNYYSYSDAKVLCSAYGAELANYGQIEDAYNNGAEFCNYGWSDGQMALFPTQKETYEQLQQIEGHENDCGRPGVNGGYMANPQLKFGVNCYGKKPKITNEEQEMMHNINPLPTSEKDILMEKKVDYWKSKLDEILVSPFNYNTWSKV